MSKKAGYINGQVSVNAIISIFEQARSRNGGKIVQRTVFCWPKDSFYWQIKILEICAGVMGIQTQNNGYHLIGLPLHHHTANATDNILDINVTVIGDSNPQPGYDLIGLPLHHHTAHATAAPIYQIIGFFFGSCLYLTFGGQDFFFLSLKFWGWRNICLGSMRFDPLTRLSFRHLRQLLLFTSFLLFELIIWKEKRKSSRVSQWVSVTSVTGFGKSKTSPLKSLWHF